MAATTKATSIYIHAINQTQAGIHKRTHSLMQ